MFRFILTFQYEKSNCFIDIQPKLEYHIKRKADIDLYK